jgi:hypothetical protein
VDVVCTHRSEMLLVRRPLEPAHLLLVTQQSALKGFRDARVALKDLSIATPRRERVAVPRQRTHATSVSRHGPHSLALDGVPNLIVVCVQSTRLCECALHTMSRLDTLEGNNKC